jgi:hypothetical protein
LVTAECLSNTGILPALACPKNGDLPATPSPTTASTSPYDYVTTVVYPDCAVGKSGTPHFPDDLCGTNFNTLAGGDWSEACTNEVCYGVPLYRQLLTTNNTTTITREGRAWIDKGCNLSANRTKDACRWPFVRMGGQSTYQRSTMTLNNNVYYLDTSVNSAQQKNEQFFPTSNGNPRSFNVFKKDQKYYVFLLFSKPSTTQTYQIYVGPNFNLANDLKAVRADLTNAPIGSFTDLGSYTSTGWPKAWGTPHYNDSVACANVKTDDKGPVKDCYILQITLDMKDQTDLTLKPKNGLCLPVGFCRSTDGYGDFGSEHAFNKAFVVSNTTPGITPTGDGNGTCGCKPVAERTDPMFIANPQLANECQRTCKTWAVRDVDFPPLGPLGFSFVLRYDPEAANNKGLLWRPQPQYYLDDDHKTDWLSTVFANSAVPPDGAAGNKPGTGDCAYKLLPGTASCPMPTTTPDVP